MKTFKIEETAVLVMPKVSEESVKRFQEAEALLPAGGSAGIEVTIAAIHEGLTRNNTFYRKEGLTHKNVNAQGQPGGLESWTAPYPAPILLNHDAQSDPIGRVTGARWVEKAGKVPGHVELCARITEPKAVEKFMRGEYLTGSIGMEADSAKCNICENDFLEGWCAHERGKFYIKGAKGSEDEGKWVESKPFMKGSKRAHIEMGNVWAREYSIVAVPSDAKSKVKAMAAVSEMVATDGTGECYSLLENSPATITESVSTDEEVENSGEATAGTENEDNSATSEESTTTEDSSAEAEATESTVEVTVEEVSAEGLAEAFAVRLQDDPESLYFEAVLLFEMQSLGVATKATEQLKVNDRALATKELEALIKLIEDTNDDLEDELNELAEAVLSTKSRGNLPDSAFALVKNVEGKKVRALPYKKADGTIDKAHLRNALARWNQVKGFTDAEKARALRKLRAAAAKAGIGDSKEAEDQDQIQVKMQALETEVIELKRMVSEREDQNDELVDQMGDLFAQVEELTNSIKASVVEQILNLEQVSDEDRETKLNELMVKEDSYLQGVLEQLQKTQSTDESTVGAVLPKQGLALEKDKGNLGKSSPQVQITSELVLRAKLGDPAARRELHSATQQFKPE